MESRLEKSINNKIDIVCGNDKKARISFIKKELEYLYNCVYYYEKQLEPLINEDWKKHAKNFHNKINRKGEG